MSDALEQVLRLVAEGRLTAEEAEPILAALSEEPHPMGRGARSDPGTGRFARIEVTERGHRAVDLRVPLSLGRMGLANIPGLSGETVDRLREAMAVGATGPILDIRSDDGDGVRIAIE